jgi:hypothetical protein
MLSTLVISLWGVRFHVTVTVLILWFQKELSGGSAADFYSDKIRYYQELFPEFNQKILTCLSSAL